MARRPPRDVIDQECATYPPSTIEQLVAIRELLGPGTSLHTAANAVAAMQSRRPPQPIRPYRGPQTGFGDPHRIATDLAPYS